MLRPSDYLGSIIDEMNTKLVEEAISPLLTTLQLNANLNVVLASEDATELVEKEPLMSMICYPETLDEPLKQSSRFKGQYLHSL